MTKITYNGKTTELADGYIATLPCKDLKMETDVVVEAPEPAESGGSSINVQPLNVTENGTWDAPDGQAYDPVTVDVKAVTEPITITENGVYPVPKGGSLDYGKEVKFKEFISAEEFHTYLSTVDRNEAEANGFVEGSYFYVIKSASLGIGMTHPSEDWFGFEMMYAGTYYMYVVNNPELSNGWYAVDLSTESINSITAPTVVIPTDATMPADLATTSIFFDIETKALDGWGEITVNVAPLPIEVSTAAEMTALLESGEVGGVYKYVGETTDAYENGALYVLENAIGTFTHQFTGDSTASSTFEFEIGMTWREWVDSAYNTSGDSPIFITNGLACRIGGSGTYALHLNGVGVWADDLIVADATYTSTYASSSGGSN